MSADALFGLDGRVAIVTGAGSGIGQATAWLLADLGAHVIATDIDPDGLAATGTRTTIKSLSHDVTSADDWAAVFAEANAQGRLDILVNNAGVMLDGAFEGAPVEALRRQYAINVEGPFLGMQGALPLMKRAIAEHNARPAIVNISSIFGQVAGPNYAAYSASKGAVKMLSKAVAAEVAAEGVRVNSVHPGPTATKLGAKHAPMRDAEGLVMSLPQMVAFWRDRIPMKRGGVVGDVAPVIAFLCGDAAAYITGAEIAVDGGYSAI